MEQGLLAASIGIIIAILAYANGYSSGLKSGKNSGFSDGVKIGTITIFTILIKSNLIKMELGKGNDDYTLHGVDENTLTLPELLDTVGNIAVSNVGDNADGNN